MLVSERHLLVKSWQADVLIKSAELEKVVYQAETQREIGGLGLPGI